MSISTDIKQKVIQYLKSGISIAFCPTIVKDKFDDTKGIININPTTQTDGEWTWSSVLIYYLENYDIPLPEDFIKFMEANSWTIDKEKAKEKVGLLDLNEQIDTNKVE